MKEYLTASHIDGVMLVKELEGNEVIYTDIDDFYSALNGVVVGVTIAHRLIDSQHTTNMVYKIDDEYGITIKN